MDLAPDSSVVAKSSNHSLGLTPGTLVADRNHPQRPSPCSSTREAKTSMSTKENDRGFKWFSQGRYPERIAMNLLVEKQKQTTNMAILETTTADCKKREHDLKLSSASPVERHRRKRAKGQEGTSLYERPTNIGVKFRRVGKHSEMCAGQQLHSEPESGAVIPRHEIQTCSSPKGCRGTSPMTTSHLAKSHLGSLCTGRGFLSNEA
jgi:hypothetical protein